MTRESSLVLFVAVAAILVVSSIARAGANCSGSCGGGKKLSYPFGFSAGCPIQLNCSGAGDVLIGEFKVQNVTQESIIVNVPAKCNRPLESIAPLFRRNYALSWQNSFLLQNCSGDRSGCFIPRSYLDNRLRAQNCNNRSDNISCFSSQEDTKRDVMNFADVNKTRCRFLFTTVSVDSAKSSLEFQKLDLVWWLNGTCPNQCDQNANCIKVPLDGHRGFRCRCRDGFEGDGFVNGRGCRKVEDCSASKYISVKCGRAAKVGILVGGIIAGTCMIIGVALLCCRLKRRSAFLKNRMSTKRLLCEAAGNSSVPFYPYKEIEKATNGFSEKQRLGTGAYGTVYAGKLNSDEWFAIKKIRHRDTESIDQVMNEIKLLSTVRHPNLVRLLGCSIENGEQILVYEFMANGTLSEHLQRERGNGLPWTIRLTIATETAHAIAHLHSEINPPIYHRDIKSSNILLDHNYNSKVADFGLSRLGMTDDSHISTAPQGTPGYLDPQYHQNFHLSDKSDVYSFGVVLVEIISALKVVDFSRAHSEINLAALAIDRIGRGCVDEIIDPFLDPNRDAWTLTSIHKVAELAFRCLAFHRDMRPSMTEVAEELENIRLSGWAPMEENICMGSSVASSGYGSEMSTLGSMKIKKVTRVGSGSQKLIVQQRTVDRLRTMEEAEDGSPVSVQDPWLSEQSTSSANSLLDNVIH